MLKKNSTNTISPKIDDDDIELWIKYKKSKQKDIKDQLIVKYLPFVKYIAGRVAMNLPPNIDFDDLIGYGTFGLIDAIDKYDPNREVKFKTYAQTRIRGAILDELRILDWTPRSVRQKSRQLEKTYAELENRLGRVATDEEVAKELNIDNEEFQKLLNEARGVALSSLDDLSYDEDSNTSKLDLIESLTSENPEEQITTEEKKNILAHAINDLPEREKLVIALYYHEDLTLKEIGEVLEVSDSRVSQLHTKAVLRLRGKLSKLKKDLVD
jgi:RNA polymerase sigma factor for flagellar operon FliA